MQRSGVAYWARWAAGVVSVLVTVTSVLYWLPLVLTRHPRPSRAMDVLAAQNAARTGTVAVLVVIGTAVTAGIAWRSHLLSRDGQYTDRYRSAIDQFGSDIPSVRLGGIYALASVARDSRIDASTVVNVLAAFVRSHPAKPDGSSGLLPAQFSSAGTRAPQDVEAAINTLGRIRRPISTRPLDLRTVDLVSIEIPDADLSRVWLHQSDLRRARLSGTDLSDSGLNFADLRAAVCDGANMTRVRMDGAKLAGSSFIGSDLRDAKIRSTDLSATTLINARLDGADLSGSKLRGARLDGARLSRVVLRGADLTGAVLTGATLDGVDLTNARLTAARIDPTAVTSDQISVAIDTANIRWNGTPPHPVQQTLGMTPA